jgi:hypothetical protein
MKPKKFLNPGSFTNIPHCLLIHLQTTNNIFKMQVEGVCTMNGIQNLVNSIAPIQFTCLQI